ncbi:MAG: hypothetical protein LBF15_03105 [Candidatus Peribacteria bacterium]|nr:hypothetical protein [Candidatus Peribacteria bacterium]
MISLFGIISFGIISFHFFDNFSRVLKIFFLENSFSLKFFTKISDHSLEGYQDLVAPSAIAILFSFLDIEKESSFLFPQEFTTVISFVLYFFNILIYLSSMLINVQISIILIIDSRDAFITKVFVLGDDS